MKAGNNRKFESGASRDNSNDKINPEAALSPIVLEAFCKYMKGKSYLEDGTRRPDDNWQKGIPLDSYMESLLRHTLEAWKQHRTDGDNKEALMGALFNIQGYLHELLKSNE